MFKVILDPGHGGKETGAVNKFVAEKDINLKIAEFCKKYLDKYKEFDVKMTRYQDTDVSLQSRCEISNLSQGNLFVSIHNNAGGGDGYEVYHYTGSMQGRIMAEILAEEFRIIGQNERYVGSGLYAGTKKGDYFVLANTHCPAVLGEFGFMDTKDYLQFDEQMELNKIGIAYAKAILRYFNVEINEENFEIEKLKNKYATVEQVEKLEKKLDRMWKIIERRIR